MDQSGESQTENSLEGIMKSKNIQTQDIVANPTLDLKGFVAQIIYPVEKPYQDAKGKGKSVDDNDYSIVLKLYHENKSFLLTGDAPMKAEDEMIGRYCISATTTCSVLRSDVLKLGHHGSRNSSDNDFLRRVDASDYIVSAGRNNKYGHPNEETLARIRALNKKDSRVRETFVEGNIVYLFD
jgi:beta-lactamase superfamily II metal-dependent hydrolase